MCLHPLYDHNLALDPTGDPNSKVILGKTLEECAKMAKSRTNIDTSKLSKWLKSASVKKRFNEIDKTGGYYKSILDRISLYNSW